MSLLAIYDAFSKVRSVCTDTRKIKPGDIFFALKGENFDGNMYAKKAIESGATMAIIDDFHYEIKGKTILVENVLKALQELANMHRANLSIPIIAITGSNGKTTTKELLTSVLSTTYKTFATVGNYNNHIGVPLTLLSIGDEHEIAVIEMGANHVGEIDALCLIAEPTHGLITNIGKAHLEGFGSFEGILTGKTELYRYLAKSGGSIFYNDQDDLLKANMPETTANVPFNSKGEYQLESSWPFISIKVDGNLIESELVGSYNIANIMMAIGVGKHFDVGLKQACKAIAAYKPTNNRSQKLRKGTNTYILDAYNANPTSMELAIGNMIDAHHQRKVLILGDMRELGEYARTEHEAILTLVQSTDWQDVYTVGIEFLSCTNNVFQKFETAVGLKEYLKEHPIEHSLVLLKGSRGIRLEEVLA